MEIYKGFATFFNVKVTNDARVIHLHSLLKRYKAATNLRIKNPDHPGLEKIGQAIEHGIGQHLGKIKNQSVDRWERREITIAPIGLAIKEVGLPVLKELDVSEVYGDLTSLFEALTPELCPKLRRLYLPNQLATSYPGEITALLQLAERTLMHDPNGHFRIRGTKEGWWTGLLPSMMEGVFRYLVPILDTLGSLEMHFIGGPYMRYAERMFAVKQLPFIHTGWRRFICLK